MRPGLGTGLTKTAIDAHWLKSRVFIGVLGKSFEGGYLGLPEII
jgi:hypothetical protein